jgi:hypothetical protein
VCGPPLKRWREHLPAGVVVVAQECWQPQAATVGRLAWRKYQAGQRHDLWALAPVYMRPSAAEEKLAAGKVGGGSSDA